jgi:hypothetical protein
VFFKLKINPQISQIFFTQQTQGAIRANPSGWQLGAEQ